MFDGAEPLPSISFPAPPYIPKVAREDLVLLAIEAELCPYVLARILAVVAGRGSLPLTIRIRRTDHMLQIEVEIEALGKAGALALLQALRRIVNLRSALLFAPGAAHRLPPIPHKI